MKASRLSIQGKITLLVFVVLVGAFALVVRYATVAYYNDKVQFLRVSNAESAQALNDMFSQMARHLYEKSFVQAKILAEAKKGSQPKLFEPPYDDLVALAVIEPSAKGKSHKIISEAVHPRLSSKLGRLPWNQILAEIPVNTISSQRNAVRRFGTAEGEVFAFAFPLRLDAGISGVLVSLVWSHDILSRLKAMQTPQSVSYLAREDGTILLHPWSPLNGKSIPAEPHLKTLQQASKIDQGTGGFEGIGADQKDVVGGFSWVNHFRLMVFTETERSQALAAYRVMIYRMVLSVFMVFLGGLVLSAFLARRLTKPLRALMEITQKIAQGEFNVRADTSSSDELGDLGEAFNRMGSELQLRDQKVSESHAQLVQSEKMAAFGQLGSGIAHEIKNPLAGILGSAQFLLSKEAVKNDPTLKNYAEAIAKESKRCQAIADTFAQFTRREKLILRENSIQSIVEQTLRLAEHHLQLAKIKVSFHSVSDLPLILSQESYLQQVILNILLNAKEALPKGGTVDVSIKRHSSEWVAVVIADNGIGISPENKKLIFEPFFTTKDIGRGPGLGLTVAKAIMEDHGGTIEVSSEVGRGTQVTLLFPVPTKEQLNFARQFTRSEKQSKAEVVHPAMALLLEPTPLQQQKEAPRVDVPVKPAAPLAPVAKIEEKAVAPRIEKVTTTSPAPAKPMLQTERQNEQPKKEVPFIDPIPIPDLPKASRAPSTGTFRVRQPVRSSSRAPMSVASDFHVRPFIRKG